MFPNNIEFFGRERYSERLQDVERIRLVKTARGDGFDDKVMLRSVVAQVGAQMVRWGTKLQGKGSASLPAVASIDATNL